MDFQKGFTFPKYGLDIWDIPKHHGLRYGNSLTVLTKKFIKILEENHEKEMSLNQLTKILNV